MTIQQSSRARNTQSDGRSFTEDQIDQVWAKAVAAMDQHPLIKTVCKTIIPGIRKGTHVLDDYGHAIAKAEFGKKTKHGWEIDHIHPVEKQETYKSSSNINDIENLRVLHWESNERKAANDARIYELEYEHIILNKAV